MRNDLNITPEPNDIHHYPSSIFLQQKLLDVKFTYPMYKRQHDHVFL